MAPRSPRTTSRRQNEYHANRDAGEPPRWLRAAGNPPNRDDPAGLSAGLVPDATTQNRATCPIAVVNYVGVPAPALAGETPRYGGARPTKRPRRARGGP